MTAVSKSSLISPAAIIPTWTCKKASRVIATVALSIAAVTLAYHTLRVVNNQIYNRIKVYLLDRDYDDKYILVPAVKVVTLLFSAIFIASSIFAFRSSISGGLKHALFAQMACSLFLNIAKAKSSATIKQGETEEEKKQQAIERAHDMLSRLEFRNFGKEAKTMDPAHSLSRPEIINEIGQCLVSREPFCLTGKSGCGKTHSIRQFLSILYHSPELPGHYQNLKNELVVYGTSSTQLSAGTKWAGTFEQKIEYIKTAAELLRDNGKQLALYIDEVHGLYGAHNFHSTAGTTNATNQLKPLTEPTESEPPLIILLSATTTKEYETLAKLDSAFARRLGSNIEILTPSDQQLIEILRKIEESVISRARKYLEKQNLESGERFSDEQLLKIIEISKQLESDTAQLEKTRQVLSTILRRYLYQDVLLIKDATSDQRKNLGAIMIEVFNELKPQLANLDDLDS